MLDRSDEPRGDFVRVTNTYSKLITWTCLAQEHNGYMELWREGGREGSVDVFPIQYNPLFYVMSFPSFTTGCLAAAIYNLLLYLCNSPIKLFRKPYCIFSCSYIMQKTVDHKACTEQQANLKTSTHSSPTLDCHRRSSAQEWSTPFHLCREWCIPDMSLFLLWCIHSCQLWS